MKEEFKFFVATSKSQIFIGNFGSVKSIKTLSRKERILNPSVCKTSQWDKIGYKRFTGYLGKGKKRAFYYVHRAVAELFLPPQPTPNHQIDHKDGNKLNNHFTNLEWVTRTENTRRAYVLGLIPRGDKHYKWDKTKHPKKILDKAVSLVTSGGKIVQIERSFGMTQGYLYRELRKRGIR